MLRAGPLFIHDCSLYYSYSITLRYSKGPWGPFGPQTFHRVPGGPLGPSCYTGSLGAQMIYNHWDTGGPQMFHGAQDDRQAWWGPLGGTGGHGGVSCGQEASRGI
jgi:hypothetical protein